MADAQPFRIIFVSSEYPPQFGGGIGTYVHAAARGLAAVGHDVTVLTSSGDNLPSRACEQGVHVIRIPQQVVHGSGPVETLRSWQHRADAVAQTLTRLCSSNPPDVIEFSDYRGEGVSYLAQTADRPRPLCLVRLHTPLSVLYKYNDAQTRQPVLEAFEHESIRLADRIVSPSRALANELSQLVATPFTAEISPHPVDPRFLAAPPDEQGERDSVLYVGRFEQRKGVETLARAAEPFLQRCPNARIVMVGGDTERGPGQASMKQYVAGLLGRSIRGRVELIDRIPRDELLRHYQRARFCVFPSHFENFPNTCLEAMALRRIVIGTDNSGMAEMITPQVDGAIVPAADPTALADKMAELWELPVAQRTAMEDAARKTIETRYAPAVIAADVTGLYNRLLGDRVRSRLPMPVADKPRVSVVIPCYNHGAFLEETLDSVRKQTWTEIETIVVDDGSSDRETLRVLDKIAAREDVRVIRQENAGLSAARNAGVRAGDAPFFVALDADDRIAETFIERLIAPLLDEPALGYCYGQVAFFGAERGGWECPEYDPRRLLIENLSVATAVVRRRAFDEAGGYSPDMIYGFEDWDFWLALLAVGYHGRRIAEPLFFYRKHAGGSMLSNTQKHRPEMIRQMIEHHRELFAATLEVAFAGKDGQFFQAHMDAWRLREQVAASGARTPDLPASTVDDELYQALLAQAELDHIENSRLWRTSRRLLALPPFGWINRWRFGPDWQQRPSGEDPRARLQQIKSARMYRLIQALKRSGLYRWYARRRYGKDFDARPASES